MGKHRSYKRFIGYSTAFRQWKADSHCSMIHGYAFAFKVWFEGELDDLRILDGGVGCEKFAELIGNYLQEIVHKETDGRVNVHKCQVWEHNDNMAEYYV